MTAMRVTSLYDLMDNAYDADEIKAHSRSLDFRAFGGQALRSITVVSVPPLPAEVSHSGNAANF